MDGEATAVTIGSLIGDVGEVFEAGIGWVGDVASTVSSNPILLIFVILPLVGLGIGLFRRLLSVN